MRVHELLSTLKEDSTCQLKEKYGEPMDMKITTLIVSQALCNSKGNSQFSKMKLTENDKLMTFTLGVVNQKICDNLKEPQIQLAIQTFQQKFHLIKPPKYTHLDTHLQVLVCFVFDGISTGARGNSKLHLRFEQLVNARRDDPPAKFWNVWNTARNQNPCIAVRAEKNSHTGKVLSWARCDRTQSIQI